MNLINELISNFVLFFSAMGETFWEQFTLSQYSMMQITIDILLVAGLFYWIIMQLRGTRAVHILTGFLILGLLYLISDQLELLAVNWILSRIFPVILLAIPIIFQQEFRRGLERLGKTRLFGGEIEATDRIISDLVETCQFLSKHRIGALIVLERNIKLNEYIETGHPLDAMISKELLISIFQTKSPLHDGAVILREKRIVAAACLLPHTYKEYDPKWGTRHKAALGLSENSDADVIVVSEERKQISFARDGQLTEVNPEELQQKLEAIYKPKKEEKFKRRPSFKRSRRRPKRPRNS